MAGKDDRLSRRLDNDPVLGDRLFRLGADGGEHLFRQLPRTDDQELFFILGLFFHLTFRENRKLGSCHLV